MVRNAYREWLASNYENPRTRATQLSQITRIEGNYGDLDEAYDADRFAQIRKALSYSKADELAGAPNPSRLEIDGDLRANLAGYRASLGFYSRFRESEAGEGVDIVLLPEGLAALKAKFLAHYPDFEPLGFSVQEGAYWQEERSYKETVIARVQALLAEDRKELETGEGMMALLQQPPANFVGWRTFSQIKDAGDATISGLNAALGEALADEGDLAAIAGECAAKIHPLITGGKLGNAAYAQVRTLVTSALALARPDDAIAIKTRFTQRSAKTLLGRNLIRTGVMSATEYRDVLNFAQALFEVMKNDWGWAPRDLWDVQGFLWVTSDMYTNDAAKADEEWETMPVPKASATSRGPTNLILYGPPGTGKTFATAERAVELCLGFVPEGGRATVMEEYRKLVDRKRISFVTFHQSYSYEDFVERLQPETGGEGGDQAGSSGGFSLRPHPGVFRQIAELAKDNHGRASSSPSFDRNRNAFKMSLGRSAEEEGTRLFREAIEGNYVVLGWGGDIDWSAPEYAEFANIKARWRQDHPDATGNDPNIQQLFALRGGMQTGDLVIISDGNKKFRAIGEVTGPYQFVPGFNGEYNHRRSVKWLWRNPEGLARELIYARGFSQVSTYQLDSEQLDWPAIEQLVAGGGESAASGESEPYVLIIDEINRANVSKVFGELITLIEPDKRIGEENELRVTLPYSGKTFGVPSNLHIIGTMNTADRSIALLDTALRRRFEFEELMPRPEVLADASAATGIELDRVLNGLNSRIEYLFDREHQIGHAFFMNCGTPDDVNKAMRMKIIPLLAEYFYEDWEKVRQVLGEATDKGAFIDRVKLAGPKTSDSYESDNSRWRYTVHKDYSLAAYEQLKA